MHYLWDPHDTHFTSSSETLNAVWELSRYTLEAASLDTYTDSNTRERRPYEADGIIAATARLLLQRDYLWPRHSHAWVSSLKALLAVVVVFIRFDLFHIIFFVFRR